MEISKVISDLHPTMPFPEKIKLISEVNMALASISGCDTLRQMTIIEVLYSIIVIPVLKEV